MREVPPNQRRQGQKRGQGEHTGNRHAELLEHTLTALEAVIRKDLGGLAIDHGKLFTSDRKQLRLLDLTEALDSLAQARAAFAECPEGAELALHVLAVAQNRLRLPAE